MTYIDSYYFVNDYRRLQPKIVAAVAGKISAPSSSSQQLPVSLSSSQSLATPPIDPNDPFDPQDPAHISTRVTRVFWVIWVNLRETERN